MVMIINNSWSYGCGRVPHGEYVEWKYILRTLHVIDQRNGSKQ